MSVCRVYPRGRQVPLPRRYANQGWDAYGTREASLTHILLKVPVESSQTAVKFLVLVVADAGGATAHTLALCARTAEGNSRYAVVYQFVEQLFACPVLVTKGEEEAVAHVLAVGIFVVNHMETVAHHYLFDFGGTTCILACVLHKVYLSLACRTEHSRHGELYGVGYARRQAVEYDIYEVTQELSVVAIAFCQRGEGAVCQYGVHGYDGTALTCVGKHLGA